MSDRRIMTGQPRSLHEAAPTPQERGAGRRALVTAGSHPGAEALAERLRLAARSLLDGTAAAAVLADPDRGPGGWVGPVDIGPGVTLWVAMPAGGGP
jgi:hypothetical protein